MGMALQYRIRYRLIDEDGKSLSGIVIGTEDVGELVVVLTKRHRECRQLYVELEDSWDDQLKPGDSELLELD